MYPIVLDQLLTKEIFFRNRQKLDTDNGYKLDLLFQKILTTWSKILKLVTSILVINTMDLSNTFNYLYMSNGDVLHDTQLLKFCKKIQERNKVLS